MAQVLMEQAKVVMDDQRRQSMHDSINLRESLEDWKLANRYMSSVQREAVDDLSHRMRYLPSPYMGGRLGMGAGLGGICSPYGMGMQHNMELAAATSLGAQAAATSGLATAAALSNPLLSTAALSNPIMASSMLNPLTAGLGNPLLAGGMYGSRYGMNGLAGGLGGLGGYGLNPLAAMPYGQVW